MLERRLETHFPLWPELVVLKEALVSLNVLWVHWSDLRLGRANDRIKLWSCCLFSCNLGEKNKKQKTLNLSESQFLTMKWERYYFAQELL